MDKSYMFSQFGVVTSIDKESYEARVYLPLFKLETKNIKISKCIPIKQNAAYINGLEIGSQVVVSFIGGDLQNGVIIALI